MDESDESGSVGRAVSRKPEVVDVSQAELVDRVVQAVLQQLQSGAARASTSSTATAASALAPTATSSNSVTPVTPVMPPTAATTVPSAQPNANPECYLAGAVITADMLAKRYQPGVAFSMAPRAILTPAAKDWLKQHRVTVRSLTPGSPADSATRGSATVPSTVGLASPTARGQLLVMSVTPAVESLLAGWSRQKIGWSYQVTGTAAETAELAVRAICTAELQRVCIVTTSAAAVAGLANRNSRVRAAVVHQLREMTELEQQWSPQVWVMSPTGRSWSELRSFVATIAAWPADGAGLTRPGGR
jgi:hypothetical protein